MWLLYLLFLFDFSTSTEVPSRITIRWPSLYNISVEVSPIYVDEIFEIWVYTDLKIDPPIRCFQDVQESDVFSVLKTKLFDDILRPCERNSVYCYTVKVYDVEIKSTGWDCAFRLDGKDYQTPQFNVELRSSNPAVLYIADQRSETVRDLNGDSDRIVNYTYVDGERSKFECMVLRGTTVMMRYHDKDGMKIEVPRNASQIYIKLNKDSNPKYLDCIVAELYPVFVSNGSKMAYIYNTLRVSFLPVTLDLPTFKINDLVLKIKRSVHTKTIGLNYTYYYYDNEQIKTETVFDDTLYDGVECTVYNEIVPEELSEYKTTRTVRNLELNFTLNKSFNNLSLTCDFKENGFIKYRRTLKYTYHIPSTKRVALSGFSQANVLFIYIYEYIDNMEFITNTLRQLPYRGTELILHCSYYEDGIKWLFNENEVETHSLLDLSYNEEIKGFKMTRSFKLKPNYNKTVISCDKKHYGKTMIELIQDGPLAYEDNLSSGAANETVTVIVSVTAGVIILLAMIIAAGFYMVPRLKIGRRTAADMRQRPALPLPPEAFEETQHHYDSPYEWRLPVRGSHSASPTS